MNTLLLVLHLLVTLALIGTVLIQRSEGGGLGIGSSQGMGSFMSGRGTANLLTRSTSILGALFFLLSLGLALLNRGTAGVSHDILANPPPAHSAPATTGNPPVGTAPAPASTTPAPAATTPADQPPAVPTH